MKKFIAVAAILSVMFLGAGTSHALLGVPDAVPGEDILIPFFIVSMPGHGNDNTLITITDVNGAAVLGAEFHLHLYDVDSYEQYNELIDVTDGDVYVTNALTIINAMAPGLPAPAPPTGRRALEIDLDFDGINDHWVGYIHFENVGAGTNDYISHVYQVSVADGMVAGYSGVSMEDATVVADNRLEAYSGTLGADFGGLEAFSAGSLLAGDQLLATGPAAIAPAAWFRLLPRVYVADDTSNSSNILIIWTDVEPGVPAPGLLHVDFWDEDEHALSSPINIPDELNFIDIKYIYPVGLRNVPPEAYIAGWIDIATPDYSNWPFPGVGFVEDRLWLGYSLQRAAMADGTTLDVILEAHRDAGTPWPPPRPTPLPLP